MFADVFIACPGITDTFLILDCFSSALEGRLTVFFGIHNRPMLNLRIKLCDHHRILERFLSLIWRDPKSRYVWSQLPQSAFT